MAAKIKYRTGDCIGKLIFIKEISSLRYRKGLFICDCGNEFIAFINNVKRLHTQSCGCLRTKIITKHGLVNNPLYSVWLGMKERCYNNNASEYGRYGGRGITVCAEWKDDFKAFYDYVIELPDYNKKGYSIDRKNNNDGYKPGNIRWVNQHIQCVNQRMQINNTSGYVGIAQNSRHNRWRAIITIHKNTVHIGTFLTKREALNARNQHIIDNNLIEYPIQEWID